MSNNKFLDSAIAIVESEPEYPGEMPEEMWEMLKEIVRSDNKKGAEDWHRLSVRLTKQNVINNLRELLQ